MSECGGNCRPGASGFVGRQLGRPSPITADTGRGTKEALAQRRSAPSDAAMSARARRSMRPLPLGYEYGEQA